MIIIILQSTINEDCINYNSNNEIHVFEITIYILQMSQKDMYRKIDIILFHLIMIISINMNKVKINSIKK